MHNVAVTAVTMHYADQMYLPMVGMFSTQRGTGNNYMYIFTKLGIITKLYYGQKPCHQPTMKIRNSRLCLPQMSLYYMKVMEHSTTAVGAQVTYRHSVPDKPQAMWGMIQKGVCFVTTGRATL